MTSVGIKLSSTSGLQTWILGQDPCHHIYLSHSDESLNPVIKSRSEHNSQGSLWPGMEGSFSPFF